MKYLLLLLLPLLCLELFMQYDLPYLPSDDHGIRNKYFRRKWPEYVDIRKNDNNVNIKKIVFIGASQGFGREIDEELVFTNQLQQLFNENNDNVKVYNWSVPGAISHDVFILTAKAITLGFDHIVISLFANNFAKEATPRPISYSINDIPLILGESPVYKIISTDYLNKYSDSRGYYSYALERYLYISRINKIMKDLVTKYTDKKETFWWKKTTPKVLAEDNDKPKGHIDEFDANYFRYFDELFSVIDNKKCKITFIMMPLAEKLMEKKDLNNLHRFNDFVKGHYNGTNISVINMTNALDDNYFYSYTHFSPYNHKLFANILYKLKDNY